MLAISFEQGSRKECGRPSNHLCTSQLEMCFFTDRILLNLSPLCRGKAIEWMPRATITVFGGEWVGKWLLPHNLAADLLGYGSAPCIHYPNGLRHSQQPRMRAEELPPEGLTVPFQEGHCPTHVDWPASMYQGLKKNMWLRVVSSFRINICPLGLTST